DAVDQITIAEDGSLQVGQISTLNAARMNHSAVVRGNGSVVVVGGEDFITYASEREYVPAIEVLETGSQSFLQVGMLPTPRSMIGATPLGERVLLTGGVNAEGVQSSVELLSTAGGGATVTPVAAMSTPRYGHGAITTSGGRFVVLAGGLTDVGATPTASVDVFDAD